MSSNSNLKSVKDFRIYRKNLPHWEIPGNAYFITFSTSEGYELNEAAKDIVFSTVKFHAEMKYKLYACVVMTTHVHIILLPLEESRGNFYSLPQIMHSIKSYTANKIQRTLHKKGSVWLDEDYDRIIRDDNDFFLKMNYIMNNPVKAGAVKHPEDYKWLYFKGLV